MSVFSAISDPTRRSIIEMLAQSGQLSASDISNQFSMSSPAISQHLKILREAGLVRTQTKAQQRIYSLDPAGFEELDNWVNQTRRFWSSHLDELEKQLKTPDKNSRRKK